VRIFINVVDPLGVKRRSPALDAMYLIALLKEEFREIRAILTRDPSNKCAFGHFAVLFRQCLGNRQFVGEIVCKYA
jgi:hypothetical protein